MTRGFKQGDRMRLVTRGDWDDRHGLEVGDVGTVVFNVWPSSISTAVFWDRINKKYAPLTERLRHASLVYAEDHLKEKDVL